MVGKRRRGVAARQGSDDMASRLLLRVWALAWPTVVVGNLRRGCGIATAAPTAHRDTTTALAATGHLQLLPSHRRATSTVLMERIPAAYKMVVLKVAKGGDILGQTYQRPVEPWKRVYV